MTYTDLCQPNGLRGELTFKANLKHTRYGWLRLTPAYSLNLVKEILKSVPKSYSVLDPFCGTGTTALACAEMGIKSLTIDINPFLIWLSTVKTKKYTSSAVDDFKRVAVDIFSKATESFSAMDWHPDLHQIEKWWSREALSLFSRIWKEISKCPIGSSEAVSSLLKVLFCRVIIESASVSFGHQSMSFKKISQQPSLFSDVENEILSRWNSGISDISQSALTQIKTEPTVRFGDSVTIDKVVDEKFDLVLTSPPYPNRMSYIRELRPYMYWLGFLTDGKEAGEMDWKAIGGTWGSATSKLNTWEPEADAPPVPFENFDEILGNIAKKSKVLSKYVKKYFFDMVKHITSLAKVVKPGGEFNYIVGNSKFYDVMLPVEEIFASIFSKHGFENVKVVKIRKRTSKKELFEFSVIGKRSK